MQSSSRRRPLVAGNWKLNGLLESLAELDKIAEGLDVLGDTFDALICPPATLIGAAAARTKGRTLSVGAQDCSVEVEGAFTGDISAVMLADAGAKYVIIGHSERRAGRNESSAVANRKVTRAVEAGLTPIICIGETEDEMIDGKTEEVLRQQILESLPPTASESCVEIAYEPVWAIGTGKVPTSARIANIHGFIRAELKECVGDAAFNIGLLYGGSVNAGNADEIRSIDEVDGVLVGGASLRANTFLAIARSFASKAS